MISRSGTPPRGADGSEEEHHGLITRGRSSLVGESTGFEKLNGQVYTPFDLAERMLDMIEWPALGGRFLDPACGDGVFLRAAVEKVLRLDLSLRSRRDLMERRIVGWDLDPAALEAARSRLSELLKRRGKARWKLPRLELRNALLPGGDEDFSCVAGNPPYLEAKRMPDHLKRLVREVCPLAGRGAFDLYSAFIERAHRLTGDRGGEVSLIVPNRFLVTSYAERLRRELLKSRDVRVLDLSRRKIFRSAAVYPIVLTATAPEGEPRYRVCPDTKSTAPVELPCALLLERLGGIMPLAPLAEGGRRLMTRLLRDGRFRSLGEIAETRWSVSFHRAGLRDAYVFDRKPRGAARPRPFLGGGRYSGNREVEPFKIRWSGSWIDYDEERARSDGNPLPPARIFEAAKVVVCQNARRARAAVDREGLVLKDTFLSVIPSSAEPALLEWLCLVLNSEVFHYLYEHLYGGTRKGGGYLHFLPRYLAPLPVPKVPCPSTVRRLHDALSAGEPRFEEVEELVRSSCGLSAEEAAALDRYETPPH